MIINLLEETLEKMYIHGLKEEDITSICGSCSGDHCTWEEFVKMADFDYDNDYGTVNVKGIVIRFKDGEILRRWEYDGLEGWLRIRPPTGVKMTSLRTEYLVGTDEQEQGSTAISNLSESDTSLQTEDPVGTLQYPPAPERRIWVGTDEQGREEQ